MKFFLPVFAAFFVLLAPVSVFAQNNFVPVTQNITSGFFTGVGGGYGGGLGCANSICRIADTIIYLINGVAVPLVFALAFIVFLYGIARAYIFSHGDPEEVKKGHQLVLWGIIAFAIMISIWGLVNVVANTFGLGGYYAPLLPRSY